MSTVNLGTSALATAMTSFAPSLAMPASSYSRPTMNPVMFCRKTSGMRRWQASSMKWAPLSADWLNRIPSLARMADGDAVDMGEPRHQRLAVERLELVEAAAVDEPGDHLADRDGPARVDRDRAVQAGRVHRRRLRLRADPTAAPVACD